MNHNYEKHLFFSENLAEKLRMSKLEIEKYTENIPRDQFLNTSIDKLCEYLVVKLTIEPLVLYEEDMRMEMDESKIVTNRIEYGHSFDGRPIMVNGSLLTFYIPFSGEDRLWRCQPQTFSACPPFGSIDPSKKLLIFSFENTTKTDHQWYKQQLERTMSKIRESISTQLRQIEQYNASLPLEVNKSILNRREQLSTLHSLAASFPISLVKKPGMQEYKPIDVISRREIFLPRVPKAGFKPEPAVTDDLYEAILTNIRHMGATFERTPQTFSCNGEDGLRDIHLANLNTLYQVKASGEAFRHYGKTDICIEEESLSAFIAECKLWAGEKVLIEALEQLLSYLTWRDCKTALIFFNKKNSGFTGIQETISKALPSYEGFVREKAAQPTGEWRFVFNSIEDKEREVVVHVFCFGDPDANPRYFRPVFSHKQIL